MIKKIKLLKAQNFIKNILLFFLVYFCFSHYTTSYAFQKAEKTVIKDRNTIAIRIFFTPIDDNTKLKQKSFKIIRPYLNNNIINGSVIWQESDNTFGKSVLISRTYIKQYLRKQISTSKFIHYFVINPIEPLPVIHNKVSKVEQKEIPFELLKKASDLREKANIMRYSNNFDSALRVYNQVLDLNPYDIIALYQTAEIYKEQKKYTLAKKFYIKTLEISPEFIKADESLSEIKEKQ